jgi:hypothetical protein
LTSDERRLGIMATTDDRFRSLPFIQDSELREAAFNHGYQRDAGSADGWLFFGSYTVGGEIALAASQTYWFVAVEHPGVAAELPGERIGPVPGSCRAAFAFTDQATMRAAISRIYQLSLSLPTAPLQRFEEEVAGLGATEAEAIARRRIGQDVFRRALMEYWQGHCPLTGIDDPALLRASHIIPWADCESDSERLNVHNGLLLAAHWDAAFDAGLVSFEDGGSVLFSSSLGATAREILAERSTSRIPLTDEHRSRMAKHRNEIFKN